MDILTFLLTLPYAPVRGVTAVVKVIQREAQARQSDPARIRRELEELDRAAEEGEISPQQRDELQRQVLAPLTPAPVPPSGSQQPPAQQTDAVGGRTAGGRSRRGRGR
jgi:hypothetical protein